MGLLKTFDKVFGNAYDAVESAVEKIERKVSKLQNRMKKSRKRTTCEDDVNRDSAERRFRKLSESDARPKYQCIPETDNETKKNKDKLAEDVVIKNNQKYNSENITSKKPNYEPEQIYAEISEPSDLAVSNSIHGNKVYLSHSPGATNNFPENDEADTATLSIHPTDEEIPDDVLQDCNQQSVFPHDSKPQAQLSVNFIDDLSCSKVGDLQDEKHRFTATQKDAKKDLVKKRRRVSKFESTGIDAHSKTSNSKISAASHKSKKIPLIRETTEEKSNSHTPQVQNESAWSTNEESTGIVGENEKVNNYGEFERGSWCVWAVPKKPRSRVLVYACEQSHQREQIWRNNFPYPDEEDKSYWYHGTSIRFALNIIKNGIKLERGHVRQDFSHGDGFYLSPCLQNAWNWTRNILRDKPAVVVFKLTFKIESYACLDLTSSLRKWQTIIRYNRSGREFESSDVALLDQFGNCDYVFGPINGGKTGSRSVDGNWLKWKPSGFKNRFRQLCIRSRKLAKQFSDIKNIESVIIY